MESKPISERISRLITEWIIKVIEAAGVVKAIRVIDGIKGMK